MRKLLLVCILAVVVLVAFAAPALALRDPFDPAISQAELSGGTGGNTDGGTDITPGGDGNQVGSQVDTNGEALANTGADTEPWLVTAYGLIAAGLVAFVVSKTMAPVRQQ